MSIKAEESGDTFSSAWNFTRIPRNLPMGLLTDPSAFKAKLIACNPDALAGAEVVFGSGPVFSHKTIVDNTVHYRGLTSWLEPARRAAHEGGGWHLVDAFDLDLHKKKPLANVALSHLLIALSGEHILNVATREPGANSIAEASLAATLNHNITVLASSKDRDLFRRYMDGKTSELPVRIPHYWRDQFALEKCDVVGSLEELSERMRALKKHRSARMYRHLSIPGRTSILMDLWASVWATQFPESNERVEKAVKQYGY